MTASEEENLSVVDYEITLDCIYPGYQQRTSVEVFSEITQLFGCDTNTRATYGIGVEVVHVFIVCG